MCLFNEESIANNQSLTTEEIVMESVRDKINERMDTLQSWMESNYHLESPETVAAHILTVSKFWSALSEEDRDYIHACRYAIEEELPWNVDSQSD